MKLAIVVGHNSASQGAVRQEALLTENTLNLLALIQSGWPQIVAFNKSIPL